MKKIITILSILFLSACIYAQSAEVITSILETEQTTYAQASYLSAVRRGLVNELATPEEAFVVLAAAGEISENITGKDVINLKGLASIYTKIWPSISGGLMYKITRGAPRYAYKLLKDDGIIDENADPSDLVTGFEALNILSYCMMEYGLDDECMTMEID